MTVLSKATSTPVPSRDGRTATRAHLRDDDTTRQSRLVLLRLWQLLLLLLVAYLFVAGIAIGEFVQLRSAALLLMPESPALFISGLTAAVTAAYVVVWHSVGSRGALVRSVTQRSAGNGGRPHRRAFGVWGVVAATVGLLGLTIVGWRRADALAAEHADQAMRRLVEFAVVDVPDPAAVKAAGTAAYAEVFWPDFSWTIVVLALLATASMLVGLITGPWKAATALALGDRKLAHAKQRLTAAERRETETHRELTSRIRAQDNHAALAQLHIQELPHRFEQGKQRFRLALAARLGDPEMTNEIFPHPRRDERSDEERLDHA